MPAFIAAQSNSKEIETVQISVNRRMEKANVPHTLKTFHNICFCDETRLRLFLSFGCMSEVKTWLERRIYSRG